VVTKYIEDLKEAYLRRRLIPNTENASEVLNGFCFFMEAADAVIEALEMENAKLSKELEKQHNNNELKGEYILLKSRFDEINLAYIHTRAELNRLTEAKQEFVGETDSYSEQRFARLERLLGHYVEMYHEQCEKTAQGG
jgi:molecular chaperone GrpE (heat shock protein)